MKHSALSCVLVCVAAATLAAQTPKYGVTATADKKTDFAKLKTYQWEHGWQAPDKQVHEAITAALDRELAASGLEKKAGGTTDVLVTYASLRRIDVDLKSKPAEGGEGNRRQYNVGTLVVLVLEPGTRKELFRARVDQPIDLDREKAVAVINTAVTEMFMKYPTRAAKK